MLFYKSRYLVAEAIRESEERYRRLFEAAKDGVLLVDYDTGLIKDVNPFLIQLLGYSKSDFIGKSLWDIGILKNVVASKDNFIELRAKGVVRYEDQPLETKDGKIVEVEFVSNVYTVRGKNVIQCNIRDITERKMAKAALEKEYAEFKLILNSSPIIIFYKDKKGKFLRVNEVFARQLGMSQESLVGKTVFDLYSDDIATSMTNDDTQIIVSGRPMLGIIEQYESRLGRRWVMTDKMPTFDANGNIAGLVGFARDITEQKRLEEELALAKDMQYRTLVENLPQKVFLKDRHSVYLSCNANYALDLKIRPEEIAGKTDHDFFPTYLADKYRVDDKRVMDSGKTENVEEEYVVIKDFLRGAEKSFINIVKVPVRDKNGNVVGLFGLFWDITERRKIEADVRDMKMQLEFILGATKTGLDIVDSYFNILYIDPEWQKVYGGPPAGRKCYEYFMDRKEACPVCGVMKALETKKTVITEEILKKEGNRIVEVTSMPFQDRDGNWLVAEVNYDITERKRLEQELRQAETLKASTEMKSKFMSMVSHELRSPMAVIKESINLVLEGLVGKVTPEQKEILDTAKSNIDRLRRLINNVLDFQKIEAGKMEPDIKGYDLNNIVLATSKEMNVLAEEKGLSFMVNIDESVPMIRFDKDKIVQVLTNLLSNAIKFTEKGSVSVNTEREDNVVHVTVEDTGPGIQAEELPRLFQAFEQLGGGLGKKRGGTGLGLAISKEIIQAHNGKIWAESKFGKGSVFHFTLPIKERRR